VLVAAVAVVVSCAGPRPSDPLPGPKIMPVSQSEWLAYVRDSSVADTISRRMPVDSLRQLYRRVPGAADPVRAIAALECESLRLYLTYGIAANVAETRIAAEEWTPNVTSDVRRALDAAKAAFVIARMRPCGITEDIPIAPLRLTYLRPAPRRTADVPVGSSIESIRDDETLFEGTLRARVDGRDTTLVVAGSAGLGSQPDAVSLVLSDKLRANRTTVISLRVAGHPFLYRGTYPIFNGDDAFYVPNTAAGRIEAGFLPFVDQMSGWHGTLTVERADSMGATGRVSVSIRRNEWTDIAFPRWLDSLRDTIVFEARFRAAYDRRNERNEYPFTHFPMLPRRFEPDRVVDERATLAGLFLDPSVPCDRLPIYSPTSVLTPLSSTTRREPVRAALHMAVDTAGRPAYIYVLSIDDTTAARDFRRQRGLRFLPPNTKLPPRVRCTLTLQPSR
jgi:hypothetical protein